MFQAIQNTYSKVQENEPAYSNVVPIKSSIAPVKSSTTPVKSGTAPEEQQQTQKESQPRQSTSAAEPEVTQDLLDAMEVDMATMHNVGLEFSVHEKSGRTVIKVMDKTNSEVIREIPSKTVLALAARIDEVLGLLFDKKV
ncbi:MAG: flagellar protein FlaG [Pseudomonadota bacterium]